MILNANALHIPLADKSVQCVVTSPPYYGLRDYGVSGQLGLEQTPDEYIANMVAVFREVKRVLRDDGTLWLNIGDSYTAGGSNRNGIGNDDPHWGGENSKRILKHTKKLAQNISTGCKPKDLIGIPWRLAFALQADGWYLRSDIIWCLSGGTYVYAKTQKGEYPMMVRDAARLDPATVKLWNGEKWTQVLGWSKSARKGDEIELVLRSGERISCTPTHKFPTERGLLEAEKIKIGDHLKRVQLPQPEAPKDCAIDANAAWFAGLYIAEGSRSGDCIQIAGHSKEAERWEKIQSMASRFGGSATRTIDGNMMNIRVHGKILNALIDHLVTGRTAKDKGFAPVVWQYSNDFISAMLDGYLSGDGHWDGKNNRWRLGFTRNYNLERDLRTACARLGYHLVLSLSTVKYNGKDLPTFRGEIRFSKSDHRNCKDENEIMEINKARCREVYDIGVEDEPHVFALASGILTHNSKPNPMPESVTDRPTKAHEYVFLLTKAARYYYDADAVREKSDMNSGWQKQRNNGNPPIHNKPAGVVLGRKEDPQGGLNNPNIDCSTRNRRTVWTIATQPTPHAHFATFPEKLVEPCILAGTSERGCCPKCGKPWERVVERTKYEPAIAQVGERFVDESRGDKTRKLSGKKYNESVKVTCEYWQPGCDCQVPAPEGSRVLVMPDPVPCVVFDPFAGSGTVERVAIRLRRRSVGTELNYKYISEIVTKRTANIQPEMI